MKKSILVILSLFTVVISRAQFHVEYTNYFEKPILGQFTYMETGVPGLNPDWWYKAFHFSYRKLRETPYAKLTNRNAVTALTLKEIDKADTMKKDLVKRAEIEALNMTSRSSSFIFSDPSTVQTRKDLQSRLDIFRRNINNIQVCGGTEADYRSWQNLYNCFGTAMKVLDEGYMPSGDRLKEYKALLSDLISRNHQLVRQEMAWNGVMEIKRNFQNTGKVKLDAADRRMIAVDCMEEWKSCFGSDGFAIQGERRGYVIR